MMSLQDPVYIIVAEAVCVVCVCVKLSTIHVKICYDVYNYIVCL